MKHTFIKTMMRISILLIALPGLAIAQSTTKLPAEITTPDRVESRIGTLEYKDGVPTVETAERVRDTLDFTRALNAYNNSFRGASAYALGKGFQSIGAEDNSFVIFSKLMDSRSLFLTPNTDTVYCVGIINLSKGPMVLEQPSNGLGTINDMWFSWIIDIGRPGPDRGEGGKYLIVPPGYDGPLPEVVILSPTRKPTGCCMGPARSLSTMIPSLQPKTSRRTSSSIRTRQVVLAQVSPRR